ncbi:MAG: ABC transporter permease [Micrococcales bacterium]|nr:ABC transporter permease [Micrococcales bacterium]
MNLALTEMRRSKLRFGLLAGAVSLLVFLVLLLTTLSNALVNSITGALKGVDATVLVYSETARDNLQASRLEPGTVEQVAAVGGVTAAGPISVLTTSAALKDGTEDLQVFGFQPGQPGAPTGLSEGRLPQNATEVAMDGGGYEVGDTLDLTAAEKKLTVVGLLRGAQFNASPTAYLTEEVYGELVRVTNPNVPFVPVNAVAVQTGGDPAAVVNAINQEVAGTKAYTKDDAVSLIPGVASISQTFGILVGLTFIIGIVVIGFFFLILTVQKLKSFTLLRAIGAGPAKLSGVVALQITVVVLVASAIAVVLTLLAVRGLNSGIPVSLSPGLVGGTIGAVLIFSLLAGLLSIRRISQIDPFTAAGAR